MTEVLQSRLPGAFPRDRIHNIVCHECKPLHEAIVNSVLQLLEDPETRKTHFFNGRYENIYITEEQLPAIRPILQMILTESARLLCCDPQQLSLGFWFNFMQKDDVTIPHSHDDDDELLSGTYYLQMPENSGTLRIKMDQETVVSVDPEEAGLTFFNPSVVHEVSQHQSAIPRISIGFNIGCKRDALSD